MTHLTQHNITFNLIRIGHDILKPIISLEPMSLQQGVRRNLWRRYYVRLKPRVQRFNPCQSFNWLDFLWISFSMCSVSTLEPPCATVQCGLRRFNSGNGSSSNLSRAVKTFWKHVLYVSVSLQFTQILYFMNQNAPSLQWKSMDHLYGPGTHPYKLSNYAHGWIRDAEIQFHHYRIQLACRCL